MTILKDLYGGSHMSGSEQAVDAFSRATFAVLAHRAAGDEIGAALDYDPELVAAHALKGIGTLLLGKAENFASAVAMVARTHAALGRHATAFEKALADAHLLGAKGQLSKAADRLDLLALDEPHALLVVKLSNALRFMCGQRHAMVGATHKALANWEDTRPGYGFLMGLHAFGLEECGSYAEAEAAGRVAVQAEAADSWGVHAVGHVMEMEGRTGEGIAWLEGSRPLWGACNNFGYHLAWHLALFRLETVDYASVLDLYDRAIRPEPTDDFRDVANAVSLLWRLEQDGISCEGRWAELHALAFRRRTDTAYVFASLHYLLALIATGDLASATELVSALEASGTVPGASAGETARSGTGQTGVGPADLPEQAAIARSNGARIAKALLRIADPAGTARQVAAQTGQCVIGHGMAMPARELWEAAASLQDVGGSHAQSDVFMRTLISVAQRSGDRVAADMLMRERQRLRHADRFDRVIAHRLSAPLPQIPDADLFQRAELLPTHGPH